MIALPETAVRDPEPALVQPCAPSLRPLPMVTTPVLTRLENRLLDTLCNGSRGFCWSLPVLAYWVYGDEWGRRGSIAVLVCRVRRKLGEGIIESDYGGRYRLADWMY